VEVPANEPQSLPPARSQSLEFRHLHLQETDSRGKLLPFFKMFTGSVFSQFRYCRAIVVSVFFKTTSNPSFGCSEKEISAILITTAYDNL